MENMQCKKAKYYHIPTTLYITPTVHKMDKHALQIL